MQTLQRIRGCEAYEPGDSKLQPGKILSTGKRHLPQHILRPLETRLQLGGHTQRTKATELLKIKS